MAPSAATVRLLLPHPEMAPSAKLLPFDFVLLAAPSAKLLPPPSRRAIFGLAAPPIDISPSTSTLAATA